VVVFLRYDDTRHLSKKKANY